MVTQDVTLGLLLLSLSAWDWATRRCPWWLWLGWGLVLVEGWSLGAWPLSPLGVLLGGGLAWWCRWPGGDVKACALMGAVVGPLTVTGGLGLTLGVLLLTPDRWARRWVGAPLIPLVSAGVFAVYWCRRWIGV